ncbi:MAG: hypothetical protein R2784_13075 [Saprospiraceae bacterium]
MGDVQQYFIDHNVRNFYSVLFPVTMAEAGANPITQLALPPMDSLLLRYYLSRGMDIDDF